VEIRAVTLNHVTLRVSDVRRTSKFYQDVFGMPLKQHSEKTHILGVGKSFFGLEEKPGSPALDHYDFGIAGFKADEVIAKLKARNLKLEPGGNKESFKFWDPDGFLVQLNDTRLRRTCRQLRGTRPNALLESSEFSSERVLRWSTAAPSGVREPYRGPTAPPIRRSLGLCAGIRNGDNITANLPPLASSSPRVEAK
jgi:catechol 2,3-dioxygenase-like lactoylglutathione lyase family enzyme